jgi:uncharacterized damage-inducible protein DinB
MSENFLSRFFEHNLWANLQILEACSNLTEEQLDEEPHSATKGTIRTTLVHLAEAEQGYLADLSGVKSLFDFEKAMPSFEVLRQSLTESGEGFLALARDPSNERLGQPVHTEDGYIIEPWTLLLQSINHATEHREQIKSMLTALGVKPPRIDGWIYARQNAGFTAPAK